MRASRAFGSCLPRWPWTLRAQLERTGIVELVGTDAIYNRIREVVEAHGGSPSTP